MTERAAATPIALPDPITPRGCVAQEISDPRATSGRSRPTSRPTEDERMLKKAKSKAGLILASSAELYREITLSALSLVSARR